MWKYDIAPVGSRTFFRPTNRDYWDIGIVLYADADAVLLRMDQCGDVHAAVKIGTPILFHPGDVDNKAYSDLPFVIYNELLQAVANNATLSSPIFDDTVDAFIGWFTGDSYDDTDYVEWLRSRTLSLADQEPEIPWHVLVKEYMRTVTAKEE